MSLFAISDLHLAISVPKPMDIFGGRWTNYMERLKASWEETVSEEDHVIVPGDISWATYLEEAEADFRFIEELPGKKIISKGNHDYWWTTRSKLERFLERCGFKTIRFMHNNSFRLPGAVLCGTRGWDSPGDDGFTQEDRKMYERELQRLELSLRSAEVLEGETLIAALHYPPFNSKKEPGGFVEILKNHGVKKCIYGHLHGDSNKTAFEGLMEGIEFRLVASDYLQFKPLKL